MDDPMQKISDWARRTESHEPVSWDRLPEIYLYMDQVITYMNKELHLFERDDNTTLLTSSMINNYVKDGVLERPNKKKYAKEHLAMLTIICMLKQVLSIQDISALLKASLESGEKRDLYESFCGAQAAALQQVCKRVADTAPKGGEELRRLAIALSIEAAARRTAAERILSELSVQETEQTGR